MRRGVPDPKWKSGPPEPKHHHSEHAIRPVGKDAYDIDGVSKREAEQVDGVALVAVREAFYCQREGCEISPGITHLYSSEDVSRGLKQACEHAGVEWVEYFAEHCTVVDYSDGFILGVEFGDDVLGYVEPQVSIREGFGGPCHGREEPDPDVHAYMYDL